MFFTVWHVTGMQTRTQHQLGRMKRAGYRALHSQPSRKSPEFIDHFVVGPTGVYMIVSESWDKRLPVRTRNRKQLWHGPFSKRDQLEHARREAEQASDQLTCELGSKVYVRPAMAIYGPTVPWDLALIREVDVFSGDRLPKYLRQNAGMKDRPKLGAAEIERIHAAATRVLSLSGGSHHEQTLDKHPPDTLISQDDPFYGDTLLFELYIKALDAVVAEPEIDAAFNEYGLSAASLRMEMVRNAKRVLESASQEFTAYQSAIASESSIAADPSRISHGSNIELTGILNPLCISLAVVGALIMVSGVIVSAVWRWLIWLLWPGAAMLADAALLGLSIWLAPRLLKGTLNAEGSRELSAARNRLMAAVRESELLAQVRTFINTERQSRFGLRYAVVSSPGLSDVYNSTNRVPTRVAAKLDGLIGRVGGASIGVAGPRGSGKSTLIREYCEEDTSGARDYRKFDSAKRTREDLRCVVAAPVDYVAHDFVLHLFATLCRTVIGRYGKKTAANRVAQREIWSRQAWQLASLLLWRAIFYGGSATALLYWKNTIARRLAVPSAWVSYAAVAVICLGILDVVRVCAPRITWRLRKTSRGNGRALATEARKHLSRIRYLQTYTSEWSGALSLARSGVKGEHKRGVSRAEQPLNYPEIVDNFRDFANKVAKELHSTGNRVFIGVDELDKIGSAEQAERFLNEIKGIFGIPNLYFMVSMSNDALTAFERRGLPLRDAFDSSFDEIIEVGPLDYAESRRLLYRRVIGLTEPYVALCHCLAGGLPRELIRFAREVVQTAATLGASSITEPATVGEEDLVLSPGAVILPDKPGAHNHSPTLGAISFIVAQDELDRKLHAVQHVLCGATARNATELQDIFHAIPRYLGPGQPILNIVDVMTKHVMTNHSHKEPPEVAVLRLNFSAYAYYCATLQEVFTDGLDRERIEQATNMTSQSPESGSFDALAAARNAFMIDPALAWRLITRFRKEWCLETRQIPERMASGNTSTLI